MITLAFYKGRGKTRWQRLQDAAIRCATRGIYSHVELIAGPVEIGQEAVCLSSSGRDGGVREKHILLNPNHWDLVHLDIESPGSADFIRSRIGARYDYAGILMSQMLALGRHDETRWFCSEICAAAIGLPSPQQFSPQLLFDVVTWERRGIRGAG